jgi:protoporphyrinogen oxidase
MHKENVVILGGGVAGLAASGSCGAPIYEAAEESGGIAGSDREAGFVFDRGIHILQTTHEPILALFRDLGIQFREHNRRAYIYSHKTYTAYPFQVNTAGLPVRLRARCVWDFFMRDEKSKPRNYEEWMYATLGKGFANTFLIPYSEKFWTVHPSEMTFEWTGNRVPRPSARQVIRGALINKQTAIGTNATFRYPDSELGYGAVPKALAARSGPIYHGHRARSLNTRTRQLTFTNGVRLTYDTLVNTIPLPELIKISEDCPDEVRAAAAQLRTNSIIVVNLGIDRPNISDKHWVHFPEKHISFFRISYPHNFGDKTTPHGTSSISAEVAYSSDTPVDKASIVDRVIGDLVRVNALGAKDKIIFKKTYDIKYAYCIYDMNRTEALRTVFSWLRDVDVVTCGRYGLWTYFWSDEAILSGKKAGEGVAVRCTATQG